MTGNDPRQPFDSWKAIPAILLTSGIVLILLSLFWPTGTVSHANWSPDQAKQYQAASVKLHGRSHASVHPSPDADPQAMRKELQQAEADYKAIRTQLDSAINGPKRFALALRAAGIAILVAGGAGMYYFRAPATA